MPAKALVPVEAFPCIDRFRGHGPLLHEPPLRSRTVNGSTRGPPNRRSDRHASATSHPNATRSPNGTSPLPFTSHNTGYGGGAAGNSPWASVK